METIWRRSTRPVSPDTIFDFSSVTSQTVLVVLVYDDVRLNVLGCVADILGTNCNKLLKLTINLEVRVLSLIHI